METDKEQKQKLIKLAEAIKESLWLWGLGGDIVDHASLSWSAIEFAGVFSADAVNLLTELEKMKIISNFRHSEWPTYHKNSAGKEEKIMERGFTMEVDTHKLRAFIDTEEPAMASEGGTTSKPQISLITEKGVGYLKFYKHGPRIEIGSAKTRKFRLLNALIEPLGTAKTIETVFEAIELPKDKTDGRLTDSYLSQERKIELIDYTMKELQKIEGLTGKIKLGYSNNRRNVWLILEP